MSTPREKPVEIEPRRQARAQRAQEGGRREAGGFSPARLRAASGGKRALGASAALACLAALGAAARWAWLRWGPPTYLRFKTMFGRTRVYQVEDDLGDPVRLLEVGGIVQSGTYLDERCFDLVFEYLKRYDLMFGCARDIRRVCVLGCGGYDYPEHLIAHFPDVTVDAVEIDPAITALARRYFFLDRLIAEYGTDETGRLRLVCADALEHLRAAPDRYDAIVNDTFDAGTPPAHLTTPEFARAVHDRLGPDGLYLTNIVSPLEGPDAAFLREQAGMLQREFAHVSICPCAADSLTDPDNVIVVASDAPLDALGDERMRRRARGARP